MLLDMPKTRPKRFTQADAEEMRTMRGEGVPALEIAETFRTSPNQVRRMLKPTWKGWTTTAVERFERKYTRGGPDECWEWQGYRMPELGHGQFGVGSKADGTRRLVLVHRFAYEQAKGPIPNGQLVRHTCDNPPCVNPAHLVVGTHQDNSDDMVARGRTEGMKNKRRLTEATVLEIRRLHGAGQTQVSVARRFDIHINHVSMIVKRRLWKHI